MPGQMTELRSAQLMCGTIRRQRYLAGPSGPANVRFGTLPVQPFCRLLFSISLPKENSENHRSLQGNHSSRPDSFPPLGICQPRHRYASIPKQRRSKRPLRNQKTIGPLVRCPENAQYLWRGVPRGRTWGANHGYAKKTEACSLLKNPCIILEGANRGTGGVSGLCPPRTTDPYCRKFTWLDRWEQGTRDGSPTGDRQNAASSETAIRGNLNGFRL